jgi:hypothetical protein
LSILSIYLVDKFPGSEVVPEYEESQPEGGVSNVVPYLSIHEIAERLDISVEAAHAIVIATLRGKRNTG